MQATLTFDSRFPRPSVNTAMRAHVQAEAAQPTRHFLFSSPGADIAVSTYAAGVGADRRWSIAGQVYAEQDQEFTIVIGFDGRTETVVTDSAGAFTVPELEVDRVQLWVLGGPRPIEVGCVGPDGAVEPS